MFIVIIIQHQQEQQSENWGVEVGAQIFQVDTRSYILKLNFLPYIQDSL